MRLIRFYGDQLGERQSAAGWPANAAASQALHFGVPYEGLRRCDFSRPAGKCLHGADWGPFGTGQNCGDQGATAGSGQCSVSGQPQYPRDGSTDLAPYGGAYVGLLGGMVFGTVGQQNSTSLLQLDLLANDRFGALAWPTRLAYSAADTPALTVINTSGIAAYLAAPRADVYEAITNTTVAYNASLAAGALRLLLRPAQAAVLVFVPVGTAMSPQGDGSVLAAGRVVRFRPGPAASLVWETKPGRGGCVTTLASATMRSLADAQARCAELACGFLIYDHSLGNTYFCDADLYSTVDNGAQFPAWSVAHRTFQ